MKAIFFDQYYNEAYARRQWVRHSATFDQPTARNRADVDSENPGSVLAELDANGLSDALQSFLQVSGLAIEVGTEKFNRCDRTNSVIDIQYDHPGMLSVGIRTTYACQAIGRRWDRETS